MKLFPEHCSGITAGGWFQFGYHDEGNNIPNSTLLGPAPDGGRPGRFNDHPNNLDLHQGWLYAEKVAEGGACCWDWGFRVDVMYGTDGADTQAFGNNPGRWDYLNGFDYGIYSWALPQAYVELARGDWSIKAGHFYTLVGYEVVTAPDNFFYSHSFTMYNSEPFTHTGVLATYSVSENLDVYAGWTLGWDTGFDIENGGSNFLGGFSASVTDNLTVTYINTLGDLGFRGQGYSHSLVADLNVTDRLNYVLQSDYVYTDQDFGDDQVGINQYLIYSLNDCVGLGSRIEWWKTDGVSFYEWTNGINYRPHSNLVFRPEVRHEWVPTLDFDETILGIDMILTF